MTDVSALLADARELEDALQHPFVVFENVVHRLLEARRIEGALTTLNADSFALFTHKVQTRFPRTAQSFIGSMHSALLSGLAANLPDAIPASQGELLGRLKECWREVVLEQPVLSEIAMTSTGSTWSQATVRAKPFNHLGVEIPSTLRELLTLEEQILHNQEGILKFFLEILQGSARADILSRARELRELEASIAPPPRGSTVDIGAPMDPKAERPTGTSQAFPETSPTSKIASISSAGALLYSERAQGFGDWELFVTDHANRQLRNLRKDSKALFLMVMKKMKDLSRGHFSTDNQVPLVDTENGVPIFKARVGGADRLVYLVDSLNDPTTGDWYQALRILGVYNHAGVHRKRKFWEVLSKYLGRQGRTYRDQCRARSQPRKTANDVFDPVRFYQPEDDMEKEETEEPTASEDLEDQDYETILSMHRQVMFSKALLNSLRAGRNISFMYRPLGMEHEIIHHPSSCYIIGRSGTGKTITMMYKIVSVERSWWTLSWDLPHPRQLFVTRSAMLSQQVQRMVNQILESFRLADLTEQELEDIWNSRLEPAEDSHPLPAKWSDLEDRHFPLLISFDKLRELLEADFVASGLLKVRTTEAGDGDFDDTSVSFISAKRFMAIYWDHLPKNLVKGLDPVSVFGEIMGVIKGSEQTVETARGYLDRDTYLKLSERSHSTFAAMRDRVYDIFEHYLSLKRRRYERDDADRTHTLLSLLKVHGVPGRPVQFLFNDEAQDNLIIDMLLLRYICDNPNGLCWAGDTAQTIALGSSFKFSELKSTMYNVEKHNLGPSYWHSYVPPRMFYLTENYRSHAGIINCAQSVVDLLTTLWPESIDRLDPDRGWRKGPAPRFVRRSGFQELFQFTNGGVIDARSEFNSGQCIIVRDVDSRRKLFSHVTPGGQVMTVYQSKGLEFEDVFLWHFFESSEPSKREWESVCELSHGNQMQPHKTMDQYRNVCRELKALYVAITRARNRLYIIEDSDKADPMLALWAEQGEVEVTEDDIPIAMPQEPDTEGWTRQGRAQMDKQNFEQAEYAFQRAGLERECKIARAHLDREEADTEEEFRKVALAFKHCAKLSEGMPDYRELIVSAAECYSCARNFAASAQLYYSVSEYTKCTQQYLRASKMEDAYQVIQQQRSHIDEFVVKRVCVFFLNQRDEGLARVEKLFKDQKELIEFMKRHDLLTHLAVYFESLQRFCEAAEVYLSLNKIIRAIELFFLDDQTTSVEHGTDRLLRELWHQYSLGRPVDSKDSNKLISLLSRRKELIGRHSISSLEEHQIHMFMLILDHRWIDLLSLGRTLHSDGHHSLALLSFDYAFTFLFYDVPLRTAAIIRMAADFTMFPLFCAYANLVNLHRDDARASQVFGINKGKSNSYILRQDTLLYESAHAKKDHDVLVIPGPDGYTITHSALLRLLRRTLDNRLHSRLSALGNVCKKVRVLAPCISYCLSADCVDSAKTCRWAHQKGPHYPDEKEVHLRLRFLCEVIIVYGMLDANVKASSTWEARTEWMYLLVNSIHIPFFALGTLLMFNPRLVPKFSEASRVVNAWICEILYSNPSEDSSLATLSPETRSRAIPCAALLHYMLDRLREHLQSTSVSTPPLETWYSYGPSYRNHVQRFRKYLLADSRPALSRTPAPGALLYLQFLLDGSSQGLGRGAMVTHLAEGLATAFILAKHIPDEGDRTLHNIVLARGRLGTLVGLWSSSATPPSHDRTHIEDFVKLLSPLLRMLCTSRTGPSGLLLPSAEMLSNEISRVINAWFLAGHWLDISDTSRTFIVDTIKRIPERLRPLHLLRTSYIPCACASCLNCATLTRRSVFHGGSGWDDLAQVVWHYNGLVTSPSPAAELIHVQKEDLKADQPMDTPGTVVPVTYQGSLESLSSHQYIPSSFRPPAPFPPEWRRPKPRPVPMEKSVVRPLPVPCFRGLPQMV